nr:PREDICTED: uncharacterized protein LOC107078860 [Lepisosteus oculatus]
MRQPPNASEILELSAGRETGHSDNRSSVLPTAAATVSGKRVSKLRRHRDGALQSQNRAALPSLPRKKVSFEESVSWKMPGSAAEAHKAQTTARTEGPDVDRQAKPALAPQKRELRPEPVPERGSGRSRRRDRGGDAKRGRKGKVAGKPVGSREESGRPPLPSARLSPGPPENHPRSSRRRAAAPLASCASASQEEPSVSAPRKLKRIPPVYMKVPFREEAAQVCWILLAPDPTEFLERQGVEDPAGVCERALAAGCGVYLEYQGPPSPPLATCFFPHKPEKRRAGRNDL